MASPYQETKPGQMAYKPEPPATNTIGMIGFILSLVGLFFGGALSPIGAILSFIGVFKEPRGLAIAGLIIGIGGSIFLATIGFAIIMFFMAMMGLAVVATNALNYVGQYAPLFEAQQALVSEWDDPDKLPSEVEGNEIIDGELDAWGNQIKYVVDGTEYRLVSLGPDGQYETADDIDFGPFTKIVPYDIGDLDSLPPDVREKLEERKRELDELNPESDPENANGKKGGFAEQFKRAEGDAGKSDNP